MTQHWTTDRPPASTEWTDRTRGRRRSRAIRYTEWRRGVTGDGDAGVRA